MSRPGLPDPAATEPTEPHFSLGKLILYSLGTGVLVLVVATPIIVVTGRWSPIAGLVIALVSLVVMVAAIAVVSRRMMASFERDVHRFREHVAGSSAGGTNTAQE